MGSSEICYLNYRCSFVFIGVMGDRFSGVEKAGRKREEAVEVTQIFKIKSNRTAEEVQKLKMLLKDAKPIAKSEIGKKTGPTKAEIAILEQSQNMTKTIKNNMLLMESKISNILAKKDGNSKKCQLLLTSKIKPASDILLAYNAGQRRFGESYV